MVYDKQPKREREYGSIESGYSDDPTDRRKDVEYVAYPQRWVVLAALSMLNCVNNWIWITWSPLMPDIAKYWDVPESNVDDLSAAFMYVSIPLCFPVIWFLNKYRLRAGLLVSATVNFIGALIRFWGYDSFYWVYVGTLFCASCQTMALAMPALAGTVWFPVHQRGLATSVAMFSYQLGAAFGLGSTMIADFTPSDVREGVRDSTLRFYMGFQMVLSAATLAFMIVFIRAESPPKPPSEAAAKRRDPSYSYSVKQLFQSTSGYVFFVVYGTAIGVFYSFKTFLAQFLVFDEKAGSNHGWSKEGIGYLGLISNLIGQFGSIVTGELLDKTKSYRHISLSLLLGAWLSMVAFIVILHTNPMSGPLTYLVLGIFCFCLSGFLTVGLEYATAMSYPADDAVVSGVMNAATQLGAWAIIGVGGYMSPIGNGYANALAGTLLFGIINMWVFVRAGSRRPGEESSDQSDYIFNRIAPGGH